MEESHELPTTSVLLIDGYDSDRTYSADQLKRCSPDYQILEAADAQSGLACYRSHQIDCVVLELDLPDTSGFQVLLDLIPLSRSPTVAVIILTRIPSLAVWELARDHGAFACFLKQHTSQEDIHRAIQQAIALVGPLPKTDRTFLHS